MKMWIRKEFIFYSIDLGKLERCWSQNHVIIYFIVFRYSLFRWVPWAPVRFKLSAKNIFYETWVLLFCLLTTFMLMVKCLSVAFVFAWPQFVLLFFPWFLNYIYWYLSSSDVIVRLDTVLSFLMCYLLASSRKGLSDGNICFF